jgi:hypothetical protein
MADKLRTTTGEELLACRAHIERLRSVLHETQDDLTREKTRFQMPEFVLGLVIGAFVTWGFAVAVLGFTH